VNEKDESLEELRKEIKDMKGKLTKPKSIAQALEAKSKVKGPFFVKVRT